MFKKGLIRAIRKANKELMQKLLSRQSFPYNETDMKCHHYHLLCENLPKGYIVNTEVNISWEERKKYDLVISPEWGKDTHDYIKIYDKILYIAEYKCVSTNHKIQVSKFYEDYERIIKHVGKNKDYGFCLYFDRNGGAEDLMETKWKQFKYPKIEVHYIKIDDPVNRDKSKNCI